MKIVKIEPGKRAYITDIPYTLEDMQKAVGGGLIEQIYISDDPVALICNQEGKLGGFAPNRVLLKEDNTLRDIIFGPCFICGLGETDYRDLSDELAEKYLEKFLLPEQILRINNSWVIFRTENEFNPE